MNRYYLFMSAVMGGHTAVSGFDWWHGNPVGFGYLLGFGGISVVLLFASRETRKQ